uniref:Cleavage stimulation factor subunit 2 hinge domain-containing protein n=1 Tax=Peronospora matthiolae TaxID=2874970 RepID=A0AAV1T436_9STRA
MRNLNGYEINGRNLRVDFVDGKDKSGGSERKRHETGSHNGDKSGGSERKRHETGSQSRPGGATGSNFWSEGGHPTMGTGEMAIHAIESAISRFGPVKLYDMLVQLKEHATQKPEVTKSIMMANPALTPALVHRMMANPALTHALVQSFKTLQISIPSSTETQAVLLAPPPMMHQPPPMAGRMMQQPLRPSMGGSAVSSSGILGMAPPGVRSAMPGASAKAGGTRWSARPGPLAAQATSAAMTNRPAPASSPMHTQSKSSLMPTPTVPAHSSEPPSSNLAHASRDPCRAGRGDPRAAKRPYSAGEGPVAPTQGDHDALKRVKSSGAGGDSASTGHFDAIAELARNTTPQNLDMLPPNERQMLLAFMQQNNIPFGTGQSVYDGIQVHQGA